MQLDYESDPPLDDAKSLEKELTLNVAVSQLASDFDRESNLCLERFSRTRHASVISTGSLKLDLALGIGGLPKVITKCSHDISILHFYLIITYIIHLVLHHSPLILHLSSKVQMTLVCPVYYTAVSYFCQH